MAVLAASICTHGGKPIISRQFKELTKERVTSLLLNFPSLLAESNQSQHTSVEDEFVRYMFQPLEEFYVVLITNKHSNILQDIDTLHLFTQSITSILRHVDEKEIFENCFDLLSAFDEIICLGYKENLTSSQIINFLEMDSHEERIQEIIERNKELEAAEASKKKAVELQFKEMMKKNQMSNNNGQYAQSIFNTPVEEFQPSSSIQQQQQQQEQYYQQNEYQPKQSLLSKSKRGGMQLGKKQQSAFGDNQPLLINPTNSQRQRNVELDSSNSHIQQQQQSQNNQHIPKSSNKPQIENNGILLTLNEKYSAQITREGTITSAEVKGDLQIRINDSNLSFAKVKLLLNSNNDISTQYKTHPNVDKQLFNSQSIIGLKDPSKPFPSNDQNLGVLRWKSNLKNFDNGLKLLPIILTTWVNNDNNGRISLTFEYECNNDKNVDEINLIIPIINASIENSENDNVNLQFTDDGINIKLTNLLENSTGSFEILCKDVDDEEALFPMEISFNESKKIEDSSANDNIQVFIEDVISTETDDSLPYDIYNNASSESYYVV